MKMTDVLFLALLLWLSVLAVQGDTGAALPHKAHVLLDLNQTQVPVSHGQWPILGFKHIANRLTVLLLDAAHVYRLCHVQCSWAQHHCLLFILTTLNWSSDLFSIGFSVFYCNFYSVNSKKLKNSDEFFARYID